MSHRNKFISATCIDRLAAVAGALLRSAKHDVAIISEIIITSGGAG